MFTKFFLVFSLFVTVFFSTCKREETFPEIGLNFAGPTDVTSDKTGDYFYVLNSDPHRDYNVGSILTINSAGEKISAIHVPPLGNSLARAGSDLIATFSDRKEEGAGTVKLFDLTNPASPVSVKDWNIDSRCSPINAVIRENYKYFAVACANGMMLAGELKTPRSESTLTLVRTYPNTHRAMHINTARNLLIAFPTDLNEQVWSDQVMEDSQSYADNSVGTQTAGGNEVPDGWENTRYQRQNRDRRGAYQYAVYDLAAAATAGFPYKEAEDVQPELHWIYFNLFNFDGSPDLTITADNINNRYYRTNFWQAVPDFDSEDTFYLSHRGYVSTNHSPGSPYANSIIKVQLTGDITSKTLKTEEVMSFERVYGFKGELDPNGRYYPTSFQIQRIKGEPLLLVNHFRDPIYFNNEAYFSLAAKVLGDNSWFTEKASTDVKHSYGSIALTPAGRGISISFFGDVVILLDAFPGTDIKEIKTIN